MASCRRSPASVASIGSSAWVAPRSTARPGRARANAPSRSRPRCSNACSRAARSRPPRGAPRRPARTRRRAPGRRRPRRGSAARISRRKRQVAIARLAAHGLELVAQHRRQADRHRRAVEQLEQRQVHAGDRLPQPLLAERPGAEALDVGHVRVEHQRQRARSVGRSPQHRDEVQRAIQRALAAARSRAPRWPG